MPRRFNQRPKREVLTDQEWLLDKGHKLWQDTDRADVVRLSAAVEALPEPYRSVVEMRIYGMMTYEQIAKEMGWPNRTWTSTYLRRGLDRLRSSLQS